MLKKLLAGAVLILTAQTASANFIVSDSVVTGADMAGLQVSVTFADGFTETSTWEVFNDILGTDPNPIIAQEDLSGGSIVDGLFSIQQQGNTLGNVDDAGNLYGLWSLTNNDFLAFDIVQLVLDGTDALIAFDTVLDYEGTPGSGTGRPYQSFGAGTATYSNLVDAAFDDLYFTLTVDFAAGELSIGETVVFMADTDKLVQAEVNAPATLLLTMLGFAAFVRARKA